MDCDVLVAGSGAAGLTCAIRAAHLGLKVLLVEKEPVYGGTTARSGGWLWIPGNRHAREQGLDDSATAARTYLEQELGEAFDPQRVDAFLKDGPQMVDFLERSTSARFVLGPAFADYHSEQAGAVAGGRSIRAQPCDLRELGPLGAELSPPFYENTFAGMMIDFGAELGHFYNVSRSLASALYVGRRVCAHLVNLAVHRRAMRLTTGNALAARLLKSAADAGVVMHTSTAMSALRMEGGRVSGALLQSNGRAIEVRPRLATVLACGGASHDIARRAASYPHAPDGTQHWSLAAAGSTGDGLAMGESVGGQVVTNLPNAAAWAPVSRVQYRDGRVGHFPHFFDRAKPGVIAVLRNGRRFVNESASYHDFVVALIAAGRDQPETRAWLIADHTALRKYGLGAVKPFPVPIRGHLNSRYLTKARTLTELATTLGIDAAALEKTVQTHNQDAVTGVDSAFAKGSTAYNRYLGDVSNAPNPCLRPLSNGPFYAVSVVPGDIGTFAGLCNDAQARVLDSIDQPIPGLYAVGNDMASLMGGRYPGGGITLGPGMTFGYIAANHIAEEICHAAGR